MTPTEEIAKLIEELGPAKIGTVYEASRKRLTRASGLYPAGTVAVFTDAGWLVALPNVPGASLLVEARRVPDFQ